MSAVLTGPVADVLHHDVFAGYNSPRLCSTAVWQH